MSYYSTTIFFVIISILETIIGVGYIYIYLYINIYTRMIILMKIELEKDRKKIKELYRTI